MAVVPQLQPHLPAAPSPVSARARPWAGRRAVAPSTTKGAATLRSSILTDDGTFQWGRIDDLIEEATADNSPEPAPTAETMDAPASGRGAAPPRRGPVVVRA